MLCCDNTALCVAFFHVFSLLFVFFWVAFLNQELDIVEFELIRVLLFVELLT